jgi:hypothetical protein
MNTQEIERKLMENESTKGYFIGVFAADQLPTWKINREVWLLVCNCCPIDMPGEHWIALFANARQGVEMFDSFGFSPNVYDGVHQFINTQQPVTVTYNTYQLQSLDSDACGPYCLYYAHYRSRGFTMEAIVENIAEEMNRDDFIKFIVGNVLY